MTGRGWALATEPLVTVCIPWRPEPHRIAAYERVQQWYRDHGYYITEGDSRIDKPFNLAAARNDAVKRSHADIVIVADADTIPDEKNLHRAIRRARGGQRVVYPFTRYVYLGDVDPAEIEDFDQAPVERIYTESVGGLVVLTQDLYWKLGGFDDCFMQWGYEDNAFLAVAETLSFVERIDGPVYAFSHEAERDLGRTNPGAIRMRLYRFARRDPAVMRELIKRW